MAFKSLECIGLGAEEQNVFIKYFRKLPEKPKTLVRFFFRTDYYTVHGEDADFTAEQPYIPCHLKVMGKAEDSLTYVCLRKSIFVDYIRELLLVKQYRVEVFVNKTGKQNEWEIEYRGSPGNICQFEELLYDRSDPVITNILMSINVIGDNTTLGIACINTTEFLFSIGEIADNEFFTELEGILAQICPRECLIPEGTAPVLITLKKMLTRAGICVTKLKRSEYNSDDITQDLNRLLKFADGQQRNAQSLPEIEKAHGLKALSAAINYQNLLGDESNFGQFKFSSFDSKEFVRLDNAALTALNVFPEEFYKYKNKAGSVYGVLDHCVTGQGRRLLWQWLKKPLRDLNLINERLDIVESLVKHTEIREVLFKSNLNRLPDLLKLIKRLCGKKAKLEDCYKVYQCVTFLPDVLTILKKLQDKSVNSVIADPLLDLLTDMERYTEMIEQTLDLDSVEKDGEYLIKTSFDTELQQLHAEKEDLQKEINKQLRKAADDLGLAADKQIKLEPNSVLGFVFRVTLKDEPILRTKTKYNIQQTVKGGVRFTTNALDDLNDSYVTVRQAYEKAQEIVVQELLNIARGYCDSLRQINQLVAMIDVYVSLAVAAVAAPVPYVRPKMLEEGSGVVRFKQVRHPCLEAMNTVSYIANDVTFDQKDKTFYVITGPNMGGKSTYIRSIGIAALMAHVGSFVPCEEAVLSVLDGIHARVGADDSQLRGMSTFMVEMVETSAIIRSSTENSLVIIDELGRGTSTYDGCGLAAAIAKHLATEIKCFSVFATHFHELTLLADDIANMSNLYVTAIEDADGITPLYQVKEGSCEKSFGIHCARMSGFPEDILQESQKTLTELENSLGVTALSAIEPSRKRQIVKEADDLIQETLNKCSKLNLDKLSDEELISEMVKLKQELQLKDNLYVNTLIEVETTD